jgi:SMI1-KNR4 cell-wall
MLTSVYVNGLTLPDLLIEILESGRWKAPEDKILLANFGIEDVGDLEFLTLEEMESNTAQSKMLIEKGYGDMMGLTSKNEMAPDGYLNVSQSVVIAATHGDEALCLDYSNSENPKVVASCVLNNKMRWKTVAESFEKFVELLSL